MDSNREDTSAFKINGEEIEEVDDGDLNDSQLPIKHQHRENLPVRAIRASELA